VNARGFARLRPLLVLPPAAAAVVCVVLVREFLAVYRGGTVGGLFCGGAAGGGCEAVAAHPAALLLGFPLAGWGLLLQVALVALAVGAWVLRGPERRALLAAGTSLAAGGVLGALWLLRVMWVEVGATCGACLTVHGLTALAFLGFAAALVAERRAAPQPLRWRLLLPGLPRGDAQDESAHFKALLRLLGWAAFLGAAGLVATGTLLPLREIRHWGERQVRAFHESLRAEAPTVDMARFDDRPWSGSPDADLRIAVVGDFACGQCRALERTLGELDRAWPGRIATVFVHAPLSSACNPAVPTDLHPEACWLAAAGECAAEQGRFDAYRRLLFGALAPREVNRAGVLARLDELGVDEAFFGACMSDGRGAAAVRRDVELCRELGLTTTPSIVVEGHPKLGSVYPWMLREMLEPMLARSAEGAR